HNRSYHALPNRIRAERRPDGALFEVNDPCGQRARPQHESEVFGLLLRKAPLDFGAVAEFALDHGSALDLIAEHDGQIVADILLRPSPDSLRSARLDLKNNPVAETLGRGHAARVAQIV